MPRLLITTAAVLTEMALLAPGWFPHVPSPPGRESTAYTIGVVVVKKPKRTECPAFIARVFPKSPAEIAGLTPGDELDTVDGVVVKTLADTMRIRAEQARPVTLQITRGQGQFQVIIPRKSAAEIEAAAAPFWTNEPRGKKKLADGKEIPVWVPDRYNDCFR